MVSTAKLRAAFLGDGFTSAAIEGALAELERSGVVLVNGRRAQVL